MFTSDHIQYFINQPSLMVEENNGNKRTKTNQNSRKNITKNEKIDPKNHTYNNNTYKI